MLKLILETGYVDPEILQELDDEQKEMLFAKLREEQIRKWRIREEELLKKDKEMPPKPPKKPKIGFLEGADGRPWVWVMGEHPDDLPYEEQVRKKEMEDEERQRQIARREAEKLAMHETRDILLAAPTDTDDASDKQPLVHSESSLDTAALTESPDVRRRIKPMDLWQKAVENRAELIQSMTKEEREAYEKRRADELYENMLKSNEAAKMRAADVAMEVLRQWRQSEEKVKEVEMRRKMSITRAKERMKIKKVEDEILASIPEEKKKELTRKLSQRSLNKGVEQEEKPKAAKGTTSSSSKGRVLFRGASFVEKDTKPKSMDHAIRWFQEQEVPKGVGRELDGSISLWFHGKIKRETADALLQPKPSGMYLVRLSHKIWGYTISVKVTNSIKHYIVDASTPGVYKFIGKHQPEFPSLLNLIQYYRFNPITWKGQEVLLLACEQPFDQLDETKKLFQDTENVDETTLI